MDDDDRLRVLLEQLINAWLYQMNGDLGDEEDAAVELMIEIMHGILTDDSMSEVATRKPAMRAVYADRLRTRLPGIRLVP